MKKKKAVTGVVVGAVVAQLAAVFGQIMSNESDHGGSGSPTVWIIAAIVVFGIVVTVVVLVTSSPVKHVFMGIALLVAGVIAGVVLLVARGDGPQPDSAAALPAVVAIVALVAVLVLAGVVALFATSNKLSALALPDYLPAVEASSDPAFGARSGQLGGTTLLKRRVLGIRVPVYGKSFDKRGGGSVWLAEEAIAFKPAQASNPVAIPYGLIHAISVQDVDGRPWLRVVWGRPELPMETTIQVSGKPQEAGLWAQEISRRAASWMAKVKASR